MMASCSYGIVEFISNNSVAIVPISWLDIEEEKCFWPPKRSSAHSKIASVVKKLEMPQQCWEKFDVKVLGKACTYSRAIQKQKLAENQTDINTNSKSEQPLSKRRKVYSTRCQEQSESKSSEDADIQEKEIAPPTPPPRMSAAATASPFDGGGLQEEFPPPLLSSSIINERGTCSTSANNAFVVEPNNLSSMDLPMSLS